LEIDDGVVTDYAVALVRVAVAQKKGKMAFHLRMIASTTANLESTASYSMSRFVGSLQIFPELI
jgi:hypothetical protein